MSIESRLTTSPDAAAAASGDGAEPRLEDALAPWLRSRRRSFLRRMVGVVSQPGIRSVAGGLPCPSTFPRELLSRHLASVVRDDSRSLQYGGGSERLVEHIVGLARRRGIDARPEEVFVTTGAQQGIDIAVRMFVERGAAVLADELTYTGIEQTASQRSCRWLEIEADLADGSDPDAAREAIARLRSEAGQGPALAYLISDAHNPLGVSLSEERREGWARLGREHSLPLLEDDPYGLLWLDREFPAPLKARAPEWTIYLGSFSKILSPGLRLGYMIAPEHVVERLSVVKESTDLETSGMIQRAVASLLDEPGFLDDQLARIRVHYRQRRDALLEALDRHMPGDARWTHPLGGMFVWVELDRDIDTAELLERCVERHGVAFLPGRAFSLPGGRGVERARRSMRLSFSSLAPEAYDEVVATIAREL